MAKAVRTASHGVFSARGIKAEDDDEPDDNPTGRVDEQQSESEDNSVGLASSDDMGKDESDEEDMDKGGESGEDDEKPKRAAGSRQVQRSGESTRTQAKKGQRYTLRSPVVKKRVKAQTPKSRELPTSRKPSCAMCLRGSDQAAPTTCNTASNC